MNRRILILIIILGAVAIIVYNFRGASPTTDGYIREIESGRQEKDDYFKNPEDSPLTDEQIPVFEKLSYFPVSEKYKVKAELQINPQQQKIKMAITDGSQREYLIYANAHFHLDGKELDLTVFKPVDEDLEYLFIPFFDKTSSELTYGGGRYVEPELLDDGQLEIDFNLAYNPYCAYNHTYRCPIPPRENNLEVSILAGEKKPDFVH